MRTQEESVIQSKPVREKDAQNKESHRRMTEERDIKTKNTVSVIQKEDTKPLLQEEEPPQLTI